MSSATGSNRLSHFGSTGLAPRKPLAKPLAKQDVVVSVLEVLAIKALLVRCFHTLKEQYARWLDVSPLSAGFFSAISCCLSLWMLSTNVSADRICKAVKKCTFSTVYPSCTFSLLYIITPFGIFNSRNISWGVYMYSQTVFAKSFQQIFGGDC